MAVTLVGANSANFATSVTIPAHSIGDIIVIYAVRGADALPSKPSASGTVPAWVDIDASTGANTVSSRTAYFKATATNHTSGTWSNATALIAVVLSGQDASSPIGGHAEAGAASGSPANSATAPAVTLTNSTGTSALLHFFAATTNPTWGSAPAGYTSQVGGGNQVALLTKNSTTSDGSVTRSTNFSAAYRGATVEILAAPTSVTVTPTAATLSLTGSAPTVATPRVVTPTAASLTLTGSAPTVATPRRVVPDAASLALTGAAPAVTASNHQTVTPTGASLVLSGAAPEVEASGQQLLTPTGASLTVTGAAPTVAITAHQTVTPTAATLSLTGATPAVAATAHQILTPTGATLSLTGLQTLVLIADPETVIPSPITLTLTGHAPRVIIPLIIIPSPASLTLTGHPPKLVPPRTITPLLVNGIATTINALGDGTQPIPDNVLTSNANTLTLSGRDLFVYTGTTTAVWTLPSVATMGTALRVFNRGANAVTVQRGGSDQIRTAAGLVLTVTTAAGASAQFVSDGTYWLSGE